MRFRMALAVGPVDARYRVEYHDYRQADVTSADDLRAAGHMARRRVEFYTRVLDDVPGQRPSHFSATSIWPSTHSSMSSIISSGR